MVLQRRIPKGDERSSLSFDPTLSNLSVEQGSGDFEHDFTVEGIEFVTWVRAGAHSLLSRIGLINDKDEVEEREGGGRGMSIVSGRRGSESARIGGHGRGWGR